jgi:uncharacterized protein YkwD
MSQPENVQVNRSSLKPLRCLWVLVAGLPAAVTTHADPLAPVQMLRQGGCGGILPAAAAMNHDALLDRAAELWADGHTPATATVSSGYSAEATAGLHIRGPESALLQVLRASSCRTLMDKGLRDIGVYRHGLNTWIVLASPYVVPARSQAPVLATQALQLVNEVRARGTRCGARSFGSAPPVRLSGTLAGVALGHAADMAEHGYFEHQDLAGRSPAERVRAVGYRETLVGENIAYGPKSAEEVVRGWLDSPGHCENIMDPRFAEMGIAYASGRASKHGLYWVQVLAAPRA